MAAIGVVGRPDLLLGDPAFDGPLADAFRFSELGLGEEEHSHG
jgi:hypothetical protein